MQALADAHSPNEFGGILIGHYAPDKRMAHLTAVIPAKAYQASPTRFERRAELLNEYLENLREATQGQTHYLGEWHTHPNQRAFPSQLDRKALSDIAADPQVEIANPLLIIIGAHHGKPECSCYVQYRQTLYPFSLG